MNYRKREVYPAKISKDSDEDVIQLSSLKITDMTLVFGKAFSGYFFDDISFPFSITTTKVWKEKHLFYLIFYSLGLSIIVATNVTEINFLFSFSFHEKKKWNPMLCRIRLEPSQSIMPKKVSSFYLTCYSER